MFEKPTLVLLHGGPGLDLNLFPALQGVAPIECQTEIVAALPVRVAPFGEYVASPLSVCMAKDLSAHPRDRRT